MTYKSITVNPGDVTELNNLAAQGWSVVSAASSGSTIWVLLSDQPVGVGPEPVKAKIVEGRR